MKRPALLLGILLYVALDLSLPAMPGAFVFDPAGSVEGAQGTRAPIAAEVVLPALATPTPPSQPPVDFRPRLPAANSTACPVRPVVTRLSRSTGDPPPASVDPH